jgi:large subunit ribosomal protein L18
MKKSATTRAARVRRHARVRRRLEGTGEKPRLSVYRSLTHIYAQVIDDVKRETLVAASDVEADLKRDVTGRKKADVATMVGRLVAERATQKGIERVVFDRGGYPFQGRIKALAEAAREGGLEF